MNWTALVFVSAVVAQVIVAVVSARFLRRQQEDRLQTEIDGAPSLKTQLESLRLEVMSQLAVIRADRAHCFALCEHNRNTQEQEIQRLHVRSTDYVEAHTALLVKISVEMEKVNGECRRLHGECARLEERINILCSRLDAVKNQWHTRVTDRDEAGA